MCVGPDPLNYEASAGKQGAPPHPSVGGAHTVSGDSALSWENSGEYLVV